MPSRLPIDCLNKIFEYLEKDKATLHSCLLVNRLWCRVSVEILWKNIWEFNNKNAPSLLNTLISCLPNESKVLLNDHGILTQKSSLFNYASFCKVLSIDKIIEMIYYNINPFNEKNSTDSFQAEYLKTKEILKMFMKQISSLKILTYSFIHVKIPNFINFFGAKDCLKNLSELNCESEGHPKFFRQLSQICHNIQSLSIVYTLITSNGLKDLISLQNGLKSLSIELDDYDKYCNNYNNCEDFSTNIIPSLTKHSSTLTTLHLHGPLPLSFIIKLKNLKELVLSNFKNFKEIQHITFSHLQILKLISKHSKIDMFNFLENNGTNLKELYVHNYSHDSSLNLAIAKFCPNLKSLHTKFMKDDMIVIFNSCQQLESIEVLNDKTCSFKGEKVLEIVAKHSSKNFHELNLYNFEELRSEDLESFFINWKNRVSQKSISLIVCNNTFVNNNKNRKIIRKYKNLGVIKKFEYQSTTLIY
ncbi:hypothetical protein C1645_839266 [Glomus cerebriforme]|uniref:F-box domain-containing protein n=1 Tax=Glomus cerebriforme TaxID=658196 RepID=A0A397S2B6_9GLOM|nr:hypothetical protein C1645_839266 [Glomus cerebriforme]